MLLKICAYYEKIEQGKRNMIDVENRLTVLKFSLNLEMLASRVLSYLLNVEEFKNSYSLGNKSSSLSFNQKINLLIDNKSITKEEKKKLVAFASIRNQFMHNIAADTFTKAFEQIDGLEKQMRKIYPDNFSDEEELEKSLHYCVRDLHKDGVLILTSFKGGVGEKMDTEVNAKIYKEFYSKLDDSIIESYSKFIEAIENHEFESISKSNLLEVIRLIQINIYAKADLDFDKIEEILTLLND